MKKHVWNLTWKLIALALLLAMTLPMLIACQQPQTEVHIGENGNWFIDGVDTGVPATGLPGDNGADGESGSNGTDGTKVTIGSNGNWFINGTDTGVEAKATDGTDGSRVTIGKNGNWFIDGVDTGVSPYGNDSYRPVLRFAIASDIHVRPNTGYDYESREQLAALITSSYAYADTQTYNRLDGLFFVGDYSQNGNLETELKDIFNYVNENTRDETIVRAILGNHEFYYTASNVNSQEYKDKYPNGFYDYRYTPESIEKTEANYVMLSGYDSSTAHITISGYHFICLSLDLYKKSGKEFYSTERLNWLRKELAAAAADDPTGMKPIFVMEHIGPSDTALGTIGGGDKHLGEILDQYPQVVNFCGHSHSPLTDPRSIWQGGYTVLNTGSLAYLGVPIVGHPDYNAAGVTATNNRGSWEKTGSEGNTRTGGMYYIIELDRNNVMRVLIYDVFTGALWGDPIYIDSIGDPSKFTFGENRVKGTAVPTFAPDAEVTTLSISGTSALFELPQAICEDTVQNYRCEVYYGQEKQQTIYRLSCSYLGDGMPDTIDLPIGKLDPGKTYTVKIYPVSSWNVVGDPYVLEFRTPLVTETTADVLNVVFNEDGSAVNLSGGEVLKVQGSATTVYDETLGQYVGVFDGNGAYIFDNMDRWYDVIKTGFTLETYIYFDKKPASGYVDGVSNQQSGGFGFEYKSDGKMYYYCNVSGGYKKPSGSINAGEWVHLVGVFDGKTVKLYINGQLAGEEAAAGTMGLPSLFAHFLAIGGDSGANGADNLMTGKIATTKIYASALDAAEVLEQYQNMQ